MPFRSSMLDALSFTSPAACRPDCWQRKNIQKQSLSGSKTPFFIEQCLSGMVLLFLLLRDEIPAGIYAVKTIQRPSSAWDFGLSWWHEGSERAHPARVFCVCLSMESILGSGRKVANFFCAIRYIVPEKKVVITNWITVSFPARRREITAKSQIQRS